MKTRCFVANLGLEPVYLSDVIVDLVSGQGHHRATITDRTELGEDRLRDPAEATNQGPLESGKYVDIGSFETLVQRVRQQGVDLDDGGEVHSVEMIAVAEAASSGTHVGAARRAPGGWSATGTSCTCGPRLWKPGSCGPFGSAAGCGTNCRTGWPMQARPAPLSIALSSQTPSPPAPPPQGCGGSFPGP